MPSSTLSQSSEKNEISIFKGELTEVGLARSMVKIKGAYNLKPEFYLLLGDSLRRNGFNDERLESAVNHVIDTCIYPQPTIAQFISFDKSVKLYTYKEIVNYGMDGFKAVKVDFSDKPRWVNEYDFVKYGFIEFKK